jgi:hypothetical protein
MLIEKILFGLLFVATLAVLIELYNKKKDE